MAERRYGHSALHVKNGKVEKIDPHPPTDKESARLSREQIEAIRKRFSRGLDYDTADINALCNMALSALSAGDGRSALADEIDAELGKPTVGAEDVWYCVCDDRPCPKPEGCSAGQCDKAQPAVVEKVRRLARLAHRAAEELRDTRPAREGRDDEPLYAKLLDHWEVALDTYERCLKEKRAKSFAMREALITLADKIEQRSQIASPDSRAKP